MTVWGPSKRPRYDPVVNLISNPTNPWLFHLWWIIIFFDNSPLKVSSFRKRETGGYFSRGLSRCRKITVSDEKKKKKKKSMFKVKETESFPGGGVRGRWKMELTSKLTRRQRGGLIKGAFVIGNCVFGGLHRLPSNKPAIYSLRHAHRMSMSWIRLQRKPTKTAVSGRNARELGKFCEFDIAPWSE